MKGPIVASVLILAETLLASPSRATNTNPAPTPLTSVQAAAFSLNNASPDHVAAILRSVFPNARPSVDHISNAIIIVASPHDIEQVRTLILALDVHSPTKLQAEAIQLHVADPRAVVQTLHPVFPDAKLQLGPNRTVAIGVPPQEIGQIRAIIASLDGSIPSPLPTYR